MRFGPLEIIIIIVIILIITGAAFIPALGKNLGKGVRQLREAVGGDKEDKPEVVTKLEDDAAAIEVKRRIAAQKNGTKTG
jgi:sec-independent protein translocase protein TatA